VSVAQTSARARPLRQYVISRDGDRFAVSISAAGSKPSHWLIHPPERLSGAPDLESARLLVPSGYKRMDRRKDDPLSLVEVWI
jgi:hypothetical protein